MHWTGGRGAFAREAENLLELLFIPTLVGLVLASAIPYGLAAIDHVMASEALWLQVGPIVELHEERAMTGRWPDQPDWRLGGSSGDPDDRPGRYVERIAADRDGVVHFDLGERHTSPAGRLSIRAATLPGVRGSPVVWVCGYAPVPPGFRAEAPNQTDLAGSSLPSACRAHIDPPGTWK